MSTFKPCVAVLNDNYGFLPLLQSRFREQGWGLALVPYTGGSMMTIVKRLDTIRPDVVLYNIVQPFAGHWSRYNALRSTLPRLAIVPTCVQPDRLTVQIGPNSVLPLFGDPPRLDEVITEITRLLVTRRAVSA